jgi:hypothetical protein
LLFAQFFACKEITDMQNVQPDSKTALTSGRAEGSTDAFRYSGQNPYSIRNMQQAAVVLNRDFTLPAQEIQEYIRFQSLDSLQAQQLIADSIKFFPFPLDKPDLQLDENGYYHSPDNKNWLYAVVPTTYNKPRNLVYETLDSLYFPKENEGDIEFQAFKQTNNLPAEVLAQEPQQITPNWWWWIPVPVGTRPSGTIRVFDTQLGRAVPLEGARAMAVHFGRIVSAHSDANGRFTINQRFLVGSLITVGFDNWRCRIKQWDTTTGWNLAASIAQLPLPSAIHVHGFEWFDNLGNINITFAGNNQAHYWATLNKAVFEYHRLALADGIGRPGTVTVYAHWSGDRMNGSSGSAPMLGYAGWTGSWGQLLSDVGQVLPINVIAQFNLLPDITIKTQASTLNQAANYADVMQTTFHEMGHASHYALAGRTFWWLYIPYTVANMGYGDDESVGSSLPALAESWAEFLGRRYSVRYYGVLANNVNNEEWGHEGRNDLWIPYGIFHDMIDNVSNEPLPPYPRVIIDNVNGFAPWQLYTHLTPFTHSPQVFRESFANSFGINQRPQIRTLFNTYGY